MGAMVVPILPGKLDVSKQMMADLEARRDEFEDFNRRMGLTRHSAWLQHTADGGSVVIALHEGPGADTFMSKLAGSNHPFDVRFRGHLQDVHGLDLSAPPPPAPELMIDSRT